MLELIKFNDFTSAKTFLEASRDAVFIIFDEKIEYVNERTVQLLGFSDASEIIGKWSCELISPDKKNVRFRPAGRNTPFRYEIKLRRKDGTTVDVETQISIIKYGGRPSSLVFSRDITERKFFESKLDALHRHANEINRIDTIEGIAKSTIQILNQTLGFEYIGFGIVEGDIINFIMTEGNNIKKLPLNGSDIVVRTVHTGRTQIVPDTQKDKDYVSKRTLGETEILSEMCVPLSVNDRIFGVLHVESDEINTFEENDRKLLETLAEHVASSITTILEKEKLSKSLEALEKSNLELDEYTYAVSHDLKAPLRSIQAFSELLLNDASTKLNEKERGYLERIIGSSKRMKRLIEDLLVLSRVNSKDLEIELIDLNLLIKEIESDLQTEIDKNGAKIVIKKLPKIKGHRVWISQVFSNLISNGLKFNESPQPKVWVKFEEHYDYNLFIVKDNGIGMEKKDYENIFKLFKRLHTQDEYPGTGAGLTISKKIVESYGGRIWLESKPGEGSTFYFTLPKKVSMTIDSDLSQEIMHSDIPKIMSEVA